MATQQNKTANEIQTDLQRKIAIDSVTKYLNSMHCNFDGHIMDNVATLLSKNDDGQAFHEGLWASYKYVCESLLGLLANPKISKKIPAGLHVDIGPLLLRMIWFFESIADDACEAALILYDLDNIGPKDDNEFKSIAIRYEHKLAELNYSEKLRE